MYKGKICWSVGRAVRGYHRSSYGGCKVGVGDGDWRRRPPDYNGRESLPYRDKLVEMTH